MNFLAHAYLSFDDEELLAGNMISDFVKGKKQFEYPRGILAGIRLHRAVDEFTDAHANTSEIKKIFRPAYRLYAGAVTDVIYDYFLANDDQEFPDKVVLKDFSQGTYRALERQSAFFPEKFAMIFPYMASHDWLYNYHSHVGIKKSLDGLMRRALHIRETNTAFTLLLHHEKEIRELYEVFFPQLKHFAKEKAADVLRF